MPKLPLWLRHLLVPAAAAACGGEHLTTIQGRVEFSPPPIYAEWWGLTEACSGATGRFERVRWSLATGITSNTLLAKGLWSPPHDIVLLRGVEEEEQVVRHEMLHDLLRGDPQHRRPEWTLCRLRYPGDG